MQWVKCDEITHAMGGGEGGGYSLGVVNNDAQLNVQNPVDVWQKEMRAWLEFECLACI